MLVKTLDLINLRLEDPTWLWECSLLLCKTLFALNNLSLGQGGRRLGKAPALAPWVGCGFAMMQSKHSHTPDCTLTRILQLPWAAKFWENSSNPTGKETCLSYEKLSIALVFFPQKIWTTGNRMTLKHRYVMPPALQFLKEEWKNVRNFPPEMIFFSSLSFHPNWLPPGHRHCPSTLVFLLLLLLHKAEEGVEKTGKIETGRNYNYFF